MSERMWSPGEIEIFIHHAVSPSDYHCPSDFYTETCGRLEKLGLLVRDRQQTLRATEMGFAFLRLLELTPLPVPAFIDPRTQEVV